MSLSSDDRVESSGGPAEEVLLSEPPRGYVTAGVLAALLLGGLALDVYFGTGFWHVVLWLVAFAVVVGADIRATNRLRARRSLVITPTEVRIGTDVLPRASIVGLADEQMTTYRVLGRRIGEGAPRGLRELQLLLVDESSVIVPTRDPERLTDILGVRPTQERPIRVMLATERELVEQICERAGALFTVADYPPLPDVPELASGEGVPPGGFAALVTLVAGEPAVGFARVILVDGRAHLDGLAVLPGEMRRGIGSALLEEACAFSSRQGYRAMTLTTYADVPWNGPFYRARGFVRAGKLSPGLDAIRRHETAHGLDAIAPRIVMVRSLASDQPASDQLGP